MRQNQSCFETLALARLFFKSYYPIDKMKTRIDFTQHYLMD